MSNAFDDYIPIPKGQTANILAQRLLSDLVGGTGQIGYELRGKEVIFTKNLTTQSPAVESVTMELIVMDFTKFSDYELLPIDANLESQVIDEVVKMFSVEPLPKIIDPTK